MDLVSVSNGFSLDMIVSEKIVVVGRGCDKFALPTVKFLTLQTGKRCTNLNPLNMNSSYIHEYKYAKYYSIKFMGVNIEIEDI